MKKLITTLSVTAILSACGAGATSTTTTPYQFVIDSGSSGSRIYVYSNVQTESGSVITDLYEKKSNTPLASFADNPTAAGSSIQPLLESAIAFLTSKAPNTPVANISTSVLGTAGMRLLAESHQTAIYQNITESIVSSGLKVGQVNTITGQYEGLYSWLDVNYLQNNLTKNKSTTGIFEVGGASTQVAFATTAVTNMDVITVFINGSTYNIYSTSFLGLGQDVARSAMLLETNHDQCYPTGYFNPLTIDGAFNYNGCTNNYSSVISNYPQINSINQIPDFYNQSFIGISSVYYALNFWGVESNPSALSNDIQTTCVKPYSQIQAEYPNTFNLQNQCANSTFMNNMIFTNLRFASNQLTAVPSINGTNLSYTLGFVLVAPYQ